MIMMVNEDADIMTVMGYISKPPVTLHTWFSTSFMFLAVAVRSCSQPIRRAYNTISTKTSMRSNTGTPVRNAFTEHDKIFVPP